MKRSGSGSYGSFASLSGASSGQREGLLQFATIPNLVVLSLMLLFLIVLIGFTSVRIAKNTGCLPPPYIYITYSDEHNILSITRDGCTMTPRVLSAPSLAKEHLDMRSMAVGTYQNKSALYVANAGHDESSVLVFHDCGYWNGMRGYATRGMSEAPVSPFSAGARHAYGLAFDAEGNLYVSYQHTNVVLRGARDTLQPMAPPTLARFATLPFPPSSTPLRQRQHQRTRQLRRRLDEYQSPPQFQHKNHTEIPPPPADKSTNTTSRRFPGTFVQFGEADVHNATDQGIRSIAWCGEYLWIANEDADQVFIVNRLGQVALTIDVTAPIGLFYMPAQGLVFVGSKSHHHGGVYAYSAATFDLRKSFLLQNMRHPTGLVAWEDTLFVADQSIDAVISFRVSTGRFLRTVYQRKSYTGGGSIEQLVLSPC